MSPNVGIHYLWLFEKDDPSMVHQINPKIYRREICYNCMEVSGKMEVPRNFLIFQRKRSTEPTPPIYGNPQPWL